ncbi:MAG: Zn-ribbon domain-containing OB-fold protein [Thermodesulfobacteriota bacterium]
MSDAAQTPSFPRPLPRVEGDAAPYWRALAAGRIELPRCRACAKLIFYPRPFCPACLSTDVAWEEIPGAGRVYTFTIVRKPTTPWFFAHAPYVYAVVELDAGVRLPTMLVECDPEKVAIGTPVEPVFERASDEVTLLHFRPRR